MIGRFSKLGIYQELFRLRDFYLAFSAAILANWKQRVAFSLLSFPSVNKNLAILRVSFGGLGSSSKRIYF